MPKMPQAKKRRKTPMDKVERIRADIAAGLRQEDIAVRMGVKQATVSRIKNGKRRVKK